MNREQQDLNWRCLPKESREGIKAYHRENKAFSNKSSMCNSVAIAVENIFGHHNLTSGTEPDEMLFQKRKAIMAHYSRAYQLKNDEDEKWAFAGEEIEEVLYNLFGDKCLPDTPNSSNLSNIGKDALEHRLEPTVQESVQVKPEFKVGDKVRVLENAELVDNRGKIATIVKQGECCKGYGWVLDISKSVFLESELAPYTEPRKEVKETQNLSLSDKQNSETKDNMEEKEQSKQIFQIGERVHILESIDDYDGKFGIILEYSPYAKSYRLKDVFGAEGVWYKEESLERDCCGEYDSWILWNQLGNEAKANVISRYEHGLEGEKNCKEELGEDNPHLQYWDGWIEALINTFPEEELKRLSEQGKPKYVLQAELRLISNDGKMAEGYECVEMEVSDIDLTKAAEAVREALQKFYEKNCEE